MSAMSTSKKIRSFLAVATVVLSLAVSTGQLTAAGLVSGSAPSSGDNSVGLGRSIIETPIYADDAPKVFGSRGNCLVTDSDSRPERTGPGKHVKDGLQKSEYDEVRRARQGRPASLDRPVRHGRRSRRRRTPGYAVGFHG